MSVFPSSGLDLDYNQITDITPLAGLTQLRRLGLYHNQSLVDTSPLCVLLEINPALELSHDVRGQVPGLTYTERAK